MGARKKKQIEKQNIGEEEGEEMGDVWVMRKW